MIRKNHVTLRQHYNRPLDGVFFRRAKEHFGGRPIAGKNANIFSGLIGYGALQVQMTDRVISASRHRNHFGGSGRARFPVVRPA